MTAAGRRLLAAALVLCFVFGSIYAFAVLLEPLQQRLGTNRTGVSLGYSLAIASLTVSVFLSPRVQRALSPAMAAVVCGLAGTAGVLLAAASTGLLGFLVGYGLIFGWANGLAYSLSLVLAGRSSPGGWPIGAATAAYAAGAAAFSPMLGWLLHSYGAPITLVLLAAVIGVASLLAAAMLKGMLGGSEASSATAQDATLNGPDSGWIALMWIIYFLGASGSLMVIVHAAAIVAEAGAEPAMILLAPTLIALGNIAGSAAGGPWASRYSARMSLAAPLAAGGVSNALLFAAAGSPGGLALLALCGVCYGMVISAIPVLVRRRSGPQQFARVFGYVFTSWGVAGLAGPLVAGKLHDLGGSYDLPLALAAIAAGTAAVLSLLLATRWANSLT